METNVATKPLKTGTLGAQTDQAGIYIVANDRVTEQAIALINSVRYYDREVPIFLIPFDDNYQQVVTALTSRHTVTLFPDLAFVQTLTEDIGKTFSRDFLALPNKMRKLATWFGPLERFLYIDVDIIVFDQIAAALNYLNFYDFICCDYHHSGRGINDIFSSIVLERKIFTQTELKDVFNSGFWGSKKSSFSYETLMSILKDCAAHREYFDFSRKTTDQPILNYLVLKTLSKRLNLVHVEEWSAGSWGGSTHFKQHDRILYDGERRLKYLHWAGTPMRPGGPYRDLWQEYRYLGEDKPIVPPQASDDNRSIQQLIPQFIAQLITSFKLLLKRIFSRLRKSNDRANSSD